MQFAHSLRILLATVLVLLASGAARAQLACADVPQLARQYLKNHVSQHLLTPEIEERAIETYLRRLDPQRSLLLESEASDVRVSLLGIFNRMREGDCSQLFDLQKKIHAHMTATEGYVRERVTAEGYAVDASVQIERDAEDRKRPITPADRDALHLKLIHFQVASYLSGGEPIAEAKERLVHRYELRTKRFAELEEWEILANFLDSFALSLDPHSQYLSQEVLEDFRIQISLSLEGIGVALTERDGFSIVDRIIPGGAADKLEDGLEPEDRIIAVAEDGMEPVSIVDMPLRDAVKRIRGKRGTTVHLTVQRKGKSFPISIKRDKIDLAEQAADLRFEERTVDGKSYKLALLDLPSFYGDSNPSQRQCSADLEALLEQVREANADGLLLDLSRNGGGLLDHAVKISGFFIRKGEVVGVQNSRGQLSVLTDRDERILYSGPMVVHTSRISASASEILAGALKDYRRAVITGDDHTFGKGTVQTVTPLPPGQGALKITTAVFFRPGGKSTQNDGVESDVSIPTVFSVDDSGEKSQRYALPSERIAPFLSSFANALSPRDRWSRVSSSTIAELARRSSDRQTRNEDFGELRERMAELRESNGMIKVSEVLDAGADDEEEASSDSAGEEPTDDAAKTPDSAEAPTTEAAPETAEAGSETAEAGSEEAGSETAEAGSEEAGPEEAEEPEPLAPQVEEALNVLADLVALSRSES